MKNTLAFFTLLLGCVAMFAQSGPTFPYQAVVRNSHNQLIKDSTFAIGVEVYQGTDLKYSETQRVTTNANGQFTMNIGGGTSVSGAMGDIADWSVAKFKITYHLSEGDIVSEDFVHPVPYALQAANATSGHFLTSDSAVITTMQSDIATNTTNIATNATNIATNTDDIAALANRVNTFNTNVCDSVATCVGNAIDARGFLTSDSAVITTMQNDIAAAIAKEKTDSNTLASRIDALENASLDCDDVKNCIKDTLSNYTTTTALTDLLREIKDRMDAQDAKIDSLRHLVDSLSGGGDTPTEVADGQPCPGAPTVSDVDGNTYNTVKIGNQCWMKENLRTNVGGSVYPIRGNETVTGEDTITYGRLYTWDAMMNNTASTNYPVSGSKVQGICPTGWHVPSDAEWDTLTKYVFSIEDYKCGDECDTWQARSDVSCIAKALSSTTGWSSNTGSGCNAGNTGDKANATGFSAVPAGFYHGFFSLFGALAYFWSATQFDDRIACCRRLDGDASNVGWYYAEKDGGFSVRCLRDADNGGGDTPSEPVTPVTPTDTFNCGTDKVKDVQNNEYNTVQIGNQCWMAENLRTTTHQYGQVWTKTDVDSAIYGRYYDWQAAMQIDVANDQTYSGSDVKHQGICPEGWHVPSDAEWDTLTKYVYNSANPDYKCSGCESSVWEQSTKCIAKALSSTTGWSSNTDSGCNAGNTGAKANATGFAAVPAGICFRGDFGGFGFDAYFWSATVSVDYNGSWYRNLDGDDSYVRRNPAPKNYGFSVRCVRD